MRRSLLLPLGLLLAVLAVLVPPAGAADDTHPEWGRTAAHDARIKKGCHSYAYSYALTPPDGDWGLETFLIGPNGRQYGSGWFLTGSDPLAGPGQWRLCQRSTRPGTYTIRARLGVVNGAAYEEGWLPDTTFRLSRKHRR